MKLTENQIEQLYKFTRQHFVEHYDVQTELVDHLANDIEEIWPTKPHLSFREVRDLSFKKFGVFGFMDVVEQKTKQMYKRYWKILWRFIKEWFKMPKLIMTASIFLLVFMVLKTPFSSEILIGLIVVIFFYEMYGLWKRKKKQKVKKEKIFLLEAMLGDTRNGVLYLTSMNIYHIVSLTDIKFHQLATGWVLFWAFMITLLLLVSYITSVVMPQKAKELLQETYPEYKLS